MVVAMSVVVAVLIRNFADEYFNDNRCLPALHVFSDGEIFSLGNHEPGTNRYFCGGAPENA